MIRKWIYLFYVLLLLISCKSENKEVNIIKGFSINGIIMATNAKTIYLLDAKQKKLDSAKIDNNSFLFTGDSKNAEISYLKLNNKEKTHIILLENEKYTVILQEKTATIIGGFLQSKLQNYHDFDNKLEGKKLSLVDAFRNGKLKPDQLRKSLDSIHQEKKNLILEYIAKNYDNILGQHLFLNTKNFNLTDFKELKMKVKSLKNNKLSILIAKEMAILQEIEKKKLAKQKKVKAEKKIYRKPAILFSGDGLNGKLVSLSSIIKRKKVVLIDFWASWCGPCRGITPSVRRLYDKYKNKGFDILTVSEDKNASAWKKGLQEDNMLSWHHIMDDYGRISKMHGVRAIPYMILIDGNGGIIQENISISGLENQLRNILD